MSTAIKRNPFTTQPISRVEKENKKMLKNIKRYNRGFWAGPILTTAAIATIVLTPISIGAKIALGVTAAAALANAVVCGIKKDETKQVYKLSTVGPEIVPAKDLHKTKSGFYQKTADGNYAKVI